MKHVLIVDDSLVTARLLENILTSLGGYEITGHVRNGLEAIKANHELNPDIIFMDMNMPVMDGLTSMRTIRAMDSDVSLIMLTSLSGTGQVYGEATQLNAIKVIAKPFDYEDIVEALKAI